MRPHCGISILSRDSVSIQPGTGRRKAGRKVILFEKSSACWDEDTIAAVAGTYDPVERGKGVAYSH